MDKKEQIRAKALELAIATFGGLNISFVKRDGDYLEIPTALRLRAEVIENYLLGNNNEVVFTTGGPIPSLAVFLP
jgi:hypothetical protein